MKKEIKKKKDDQLNWIDGRISRATEMQGDLTVVDGQIRTKGKNSTGGVGAINPNNDDASAYLGFSGEGEDTVARIRLRGDGEGADGPFQIQERGDRVRMSVETDGTTINGTLVVKEEVTAPKFSGDLSGNATTAQTANTASTAIRLQTPRNINGTPFSGAEAITTAHWGTSRSITIGNTTRSVNGSGNVSWSLEDVGAAPSTHIHNANDINEGTLAIGRIPTGSGSTQVALGNHTHATATPTTNGFMSGADKARFDSITPATTNPVAPGTAEVGTANTFARADHRHPLPTATQIGAAAVDHTHTWDSITGMSTTFAPSVHTHNANDINAGTLHLDRIPNLPASRINSDTFDVARIPNLPADRITSGTLPISRGGTGAATAAAARTSLGAAATTHTHHANTLTNATPASANNSGRAIIGDWCIVWGQFNTVSLGIGNSTQNVINFGITFAHTPNVQATAHSTNFTCAINGLSTTSVTLGTRHTVSVNAGVATVRWVATGRRA